MNDGKELKDDVVRHMQERIKNVLTTLNTYRMQHPTEMRIEHIMGQIERIDDALERNERLTFRELQDLDFSLTEGTSLEQDEHLGRELYSIKNFADNNF